ncbi:MAG: riboflavin biosynthesis protein RibF [Bacteroidales bacterium]|nr:riboflavin biosynthesis protein RibF [Bacteroidales bacterium]
MRKVAVVTTGFFDGVHLGHRHVLETVVSCARERGQEAVVVTFWPHPRTVLQQDARGFRLLTSLEEKKVLLADAGIDRVEVLPFTRDFAAMKADEYISLLRERFDASLVVMGYDNRIGTDRLTSSEISEPGVVTVDEFAFAGLTASENYFSQGFANAISSTQIRKALEAGDVDLANTMLGYRYGLYGVVVAGNRVGRTIGFPTANMQLYEPLKLVPANGVYAVEVQVLGKKYRGMCNIGTRPTVGGTTRTIETHILDFNEDIYGLPLQIRFLARIRDERKFPSLEALKEQLKKDAKDCGCM